MTHATTIPFNEMSTATVSTQGEHDLQASWLRAFRVMHRLMAERIVKSDPHRADRHFRRDAQRKGLEPRDVVVVELRRHPQPTSEGHLPDDAHYSHRFIVSGHWRDQWYPSLKAHRQKWIGSYVKGPDDAPLVVKDRVWVWDR